MSYTMTTNMVIVATDGWVSGKCPLDARLYR
jgi:hypothetical protein